MSTTQPVVAPDDEPRHLRAHPDDPNHHLWRNGRLWWIAITVEGADGTRWRVRRSLKTANLEEARRRRDAALERARSKTAFRLAGSLAAPVG